MMHTNRSARRWVLAATGLIAAVISAPAIAQEVTPATGAAADAAATEELETVVVKGLRKSLQSAVNRKRRAAQIVDLIDAEDAGKLPDNNVNEAIARITGVQIERERGEGSGLKIRGMEDVQTTLNGSPNNTGVGRSASLNDIPAELLKSVQVYKNRTADQVEGGIAGTVNVDLRRPMDLAKGWTLAGSVRQVNANVGSTESPYASALIANRFDTPIGEMGFLLNASFQENNYNEQWVISETPALFWGTQQSSLPRDPSVPLPALSGEQLTAIAPYKVQNGIQRGKTERNAYNLAFQWKPNENLDFLIEAIGFDVDERRAVDFLEASPKEGPGALSNVVYMPDGKTIKSVTVSDINPTDGNLLAVGPFARDDIYTTRNSRLNAEVHWRKDRWAVNASISKDENRFDDDWYLQILRLNGLAAVNFDFASDKMAETGPYVEYLDASGNPIDLTNVDNYNLRQIENGKGYETSDEDAYSLDVTYRFSDDKLIRSLQLGARKTTREIERLYGYRYAGFIDDKAIKLADFPGGDQLDTVYADVPGYQSAEWYRLSLDSYLSNFDTIRGLASNNATVSYGGGGAWDPILQREFPGIDQWATPEVQTERMMGTFNSVEDTAAVYAQLFYGFDLFNIPIDGVIGARNVKTKGESFSFDRQIDITDPDNDPLTNNNVTTVRMVPRTTELDYSDLLPSAHMVAHFTPKMQLRLAYSQNVQRPNFFQATSFTFLNSVVVYPGQEATAIGSGWGGNAELNANREDNFDASLEYYFGRGGVVSFAAYLKKPDGFIYDAQGEETIDGKRYLIWRPRNASEGIFQGYEFNAQGFFDFLPGKLANFGGQFNYSYNQIAKINYGGEDNNAVGNSKYTYNAILYYDTPQFNARIAYNYRDRFRINATPTPYSQYSPYMEATSRLDAAVNWTPIKQVTLALEATNLLENNTELSWGEDRLLPQGVRVQARTIQLSARFRY
ncbi:TonB-dependent receptor [Asticcacaulis sp. ZE23SCel15]|uniref:TonB-dependent receptor n=1 Tax=Asticcacaulis sp. ZE23SCel15 TaxID=3059027 RepID=UPI00265F0F43|nr:TonB-dependent receptor [Asticcacaulis sp. ZE23SCel15]WKL57494.1 TonB-dependent receptor [Asticcacaulis sp. ZE23SCel15]